MMGKIERFPSRASSIQRTRSDTSPSCPRTCRTGHTVKSKGIEKYMNSQADLLVFAPVSSLAWA